MFNVTVLLYGALIVLVLNQQCVICARKYALDSPLLRLCNGCDTLTRLQRSANAIRQGECIRLRVTRLARFCLFPVKARADFTAHPKQFGTDFDGD